MGFAKSGTLFHFKMQFDEEVAVIMVCRNFVDSEAAALRDGANSFKGMLILPGARLHVDQYIRRNNLADTLFHPFAGGVGLLQTGGAGNADGGTHKISLTGAAYPGAFGAQDAFRFIHSVDDALAQSSRSHIEQGVGGAFAEA